MAFTGYVFKSRKEIEPFAECSDGGVTFNWAKKHARRLLCTVICGYVEMEKQDHEPPKFYNSMLMVDPDGQVVCNPRKTFLYETDKPWATAGDGFISLFCPALKKNVSLGICMDINPYNFTAPFDKYEFGNYVVKEHPSELVIFSCAWNDFDSEQEDVMPTLQYWASRLTPITEAIQMGAYGFKDCYFICSNRTGTENGVHFVGASCVLSLKKPEIISSASRNEEVVLQVTLPI
uniref:Uncharacterized protein AlNc14C190G8430 n=1 Tax=Albugo laibachii Nc14 TaxID=890382 RepID=F0WPT8_9STRA|nr:hypothetical protein FG07204.1 [Albugo laibachii Nc14]|eukprot:CCA23339.1 hypothetical protein FG07204.1 [Albugo laibachii Nc14]